MGTRWASRGWAAMTELGDRAASVIPGLLMLFFLVTIGLVAAWIARVLTTRIARLFGFDRAMERWGVAPSRRRSGIVRPPADSLGATAFLVAFVPPLLTSILILIVGIVIANFAGHGVLIAAVNAGLPEARLLARAAQWAVLLFAAATALTQLGIGKEMVLVAFGITFGGLVFALALAFGLGGRARAAPSARETGTSPQREEHVADSRASEPHMLEFVASVSPGDARGR